MKNFCEDLYFFWRALALVSLVFGLGLEHSCPWPREGLSSERLSLASDFFCVLGLGLEPCVFDSTSGAFDIFLCSANQACKASVLSTFVASFPFDALNYAVYSVRSNIKTGRWSVRFSSGSQHHGPNLHSEANLREILGVWQRSLCMLCRS